VRTTGFRALAAAAAIVLGLSAAAAEPDGRLALRYEWLGDKDPSAKTATLRLTITAAVPVRETRIAAALPRGTALALRTGAAQPNPWPAHGLSVGDLSRGQTVVFDVDVDKPATGGGLMSFSIEGSADGVALTESVGVYVGEPAVKPVVRDGVIEYPAEGQGSDR
jgi:hypothetical protein